MLLAHKLYHWHQKIYADLLRRMLNTGNLRFIFINNNCTQLLESSQLIWLSDSITLVDTFYTKSLVLIIKEAKKQSGPNMYWHDYSFSSYDFKRDIWKGESKNTFIKLRFPLNIHIWCVRTNIWWNWIFYDLRVRNPVCHFEICFFTYIN